MAELSREAVSEIFSRAKTIVWEAGVCGINASGLSRALNCELSIAFVCLSELRGDGTIEQTDPSDLNPSSSTVWKVKAEIANAAWLEAQRERNV